MTMGSTMAWWIAALDPRVYVCIDICCMTDYHTILKEKALDKHGLYYYIPNLLNEFTTAEINELIHPRPHLCLAGIKDPLTPLEGLYKIDSHLKKVYAGSDAWQMKKYKSKHKETAAMRKEIISFLEEWL